MKYKYVFVCGWVVLVLTYMYVYKHTYLGLKISRFASPNANYSWGNCESFWQNDSPNFLGTCESLVANCKSLFK